MYIFGAFLVFHEGTLQANPQIFECCCSGNGTKSAIVSSQQIQSHYVFTKFLHIVTSNRIDHTVFHVCQRHHVSDAQIFRMPKKKKLPNFGPHVASVMIFWGWSFWDISSSHICRLAYKMCIGCSPLREKSHHLDYSICRTPLLTFTFHFCWVATPNVFIGIATDLKISPGQSCVFCGLRHLIQRQAELPSKFPQVPFLEGWRKLGGNMFYEEKDITKMTKNEREV